MKKIETTHGYNIMGDDNNSGFSSRNKTSNGRVMCFVIVSMMMANNIYNNYTRLRYNVGFRCFDAATFANFRDARAPLGAATHSLNTSGI